MQPPPSLSLSAVNVVSPANVADPIPFNPPHLGRSAIRKLPIMIREDKVVEQVVLQTPSNNFYELGRVLREAIYGQVNHAVALYSLDGTVYQRVNPIRQVAIKVYSQARLRSMRGRTQENPVAELAAMQLIGQHPNVLTALEICHDAENIYSILEFCDGGELYDVIEESGAMPEAFARGFFRQILQGLAHLHQLGIAHRDLSLENVLFSRATNNCKIIDFGMALRLPRDEATGEVYLLPPQGVCGKRNYISPEVIDNRLPFNALHSDIWALGVILFIMLTGVPPVDTATPLDPRFRMVSAGLIGNMLDQWGIALSPLALDLINRTLRPNPSERLSLYEIAEHPWVREG
jgi:serine/threonine protein kinase